MTLLREGIHFMFLKLLLQTCTISDTIKYNQILKYFIFLTKYLKNNPQIIFLLVSPSAHYPSKGELFIINLRGNYFLACFLLYFLQENKIHNSECMVCSSDFENFCPLLPLYSAGCMHKAETVLVVDLG